MPQVFGQHLAQVVLIDNQQPQGAYHPFADSVCPGRLRRAGENPDARCREHGIEGISELARAIPDQELDAFRARAEVHQEVQAVEFPAEPSPVACENEDELFAAERALVAG
jgi:hypothetical protein